MSTSESLGKCFNIKSCKIRHIVMLRLLLRRWHSKARMSASTRGLHPDVPHGHLAVYVGPRSRRFIVPTSYLNHPIFVKLLAQTEEECGLNRQGPITFPCEESLFEEVLCAVSRSVSGRSVRSVSLEELQLMNCQGGVRNGLDQWTESRSLLKESSY